MRFCARAGVFSILVGFLSSLFSSPASEPVPVPEGIPTVETVAADEAESLPHETAELSALLRAVPADADGVPLDTEPITDECELLPEVAESVIPPATPVSSMVPMTGPLPIIDVRTDEPSFTAVNRDGRIVLPSLIGYCEADLAAMDTGGITVRYAYDWYPLPEGVIYAASFTGEMTEDEFRIHPESILTLHVSRGMTPDISVLTKESRTVYLTFDDGPHSANTESILNTLDEYGIKATFFVVGSYAARYPAVIREIYERGHKIGCHSYTHNYNSLYKSAESMMAEVEKWENAVRDALGFLPPERLFRYPGGSTNCGNAEIHEALLKAGYRVFDWNALNNDCLLHTRPADVSDLDFMKESFTETMAYSFRMKTFPHIVLMHDSYAQTAELLPWILDYLLELGCSFATPDELPAGWTY